MTAFGSASVRDRGGTWLRPVLTAFALAALAGLAGAGAGALAGTSTPWHALLVGIVLVLAAVPFLMWKSPSRAVLALFLASVVVEQFAYQVGPRAGAWTANLPVFHSLVPGTGVTPAEVYLAILGVIVVAQGTGFQGRSLRVTALGRRLQLLGALVVIYLLVGLMRHGDVKMAFWEARPFLYLSAIYWLARRVVKGGEFVRALLWTLTLGSAAKAAYGIVIWLSIRNLNPRPEAILAHEESFFFGLYVVMTVGLWIIGMRGRLRVTATALLPVVVCADAFNSRRTAWALLLCGLATLFIVVYACMPQRRPVVRRVAASIAVVGAVYLPAFWNDNGTLAQPARAVRSIFSPDARDQQSNDYRFVEDADLSINIQMHKSTGTGYGVPIDYVVPIVDLTDIDSAIAYIPHDGVLYVWMRLGLVGEIALWLVVAEGVRLSSTLARVGRSEDALFGALVAAGVVCWVVIGWKDMGFYWFRIALTIGLLLGVVDARLRATRLASTSTTPVGNPATEREITEVLVSS